MMSRYGKAVIRWLILCFPAGLLMMWSDRCRWSRVVKCAISTVIAGLLVTLVLPQTLPPERAAGGIEIVSLAPAADVQGPNPPDDFVVDKTYIPTFVQMPTVIIEPTPTPDPIYVYCNDGGKNYHANKCRYVRKTSARVTLSQALNAGFSQCKECNAPAEHLG